MFIGPLARQPCERTIGFPGGGKIIRVKLKPAIPEKPLGIVRIKRHGPGIGLARGFRVAQPGDGAEIAIGNRRFLPVLLMRAVFLSSATAVRSCAASAVLFSFNRLS